VGVGRKVRVRQKEPSVRCGAEANCINARCYRCWQARQVKAREMPRQVVFVSAGMGMYSVKVLFAGAAGACVQRSNGNAYSAGTPVQRNALLRG